MRTLADWLDHIQRQHPREIALGLERVRAVEARMGLGRPAPVVITVAGTNGKGSTVAFLEAMARAGGYRIGAYTSPHLLRYNERVRIDGREVDDAPLCEAFARIERAREHTPLTYFEYGTLAALDLFERARIDVALLEVGLGGRLDAVNVVDADAAIVTTVDLDHQDWLGSDRGAIAREKAGVFRAGRPAILGEREPAPELEQQARGIGAALVRRDVDFFVEPAGDGAWSWRHSDGTLHRLPEPGLEAPVQRDNAASAIAALHVLRERLPLAGSALATGVAGASVAARLQRIPGTVDVVVDVAHNPQAAREVARWLERNPPAGRTLAVFAALGDKDIEGIVRALAPNVSRWLLAGLADQTPRGLDAATLATRIGPEPGAGVATTHETVADACAAARSLAIAGDRILVVGSFFTAAAAIRHFGAPGRSDAPL